MKVYELMAKLELSKAGSILTISIPDSVTKKEIVENGLDVTSVDIDDDSGVVTIFCEVA